MTRSLRARALRKHAEEQNGIDGEDGGDRDRQPRQVPLDDVGSALRRRREAHPSKTGVATRVHEDEPDQGHRDEHVPDR